MEQKQYDLLFRWFVGLGIDDPVWVPTVFTKDRDWLLTTEMSRKVMAATSPETVAMLCFIVTVRPDRSASATA